MSDSYGQESNNQFGRDTASHTGAREGVADRFDGSNNTTGFGQTTTSGQGDFSNRSNETGTSGYNTLGHSGNTGEAQGFGSNNQDTFGSTVNTAEGHGSSDLGASGGDFGRSAMDHNSRTGGGASALDHNSRTGGGISATDYNSGAGNTGGGIDAGSGAGARYGTDNTPGTTLNEYAAGSDNHAGKPSMGDKLQGGAEKLVGKLTKNPEKVERGQERKEGEFSQNRGANNENF
ncbi:hypothetical protein C8R43DRAFT_570400 [Mycena crocata]|nr:hypothetical protein C8R43DRAFT_570400 [Mycena crocata]